jgi:pimeloyl-ACP methyl ester carboxylesterase
MLNLKNMEMRKSFYLLSFMLLASNLIHSQECADGRYFDETFTVDVDASIQFGENAQPTILNPNNIQELFLDVYQPDGDTLSTRPLIIWAFGGAFLFGSKESPDIVTLSSSFAKRGYVCAAIDYRLSDNLITSGLVVDRATQYEAVLKAIHDMRSSIRFFYKDAATTNDYRIDTSRIYLGGVSAGAITALQIAHFDELNEVPAEMDSVFNATGGFEGTSGNPGYSEDIAGVVSLCGALLDTAWINPAITTPIVSMHGTADNIVPYGSDTVDILNVDFPLDGSASVHDKLDQYGIQNAFYTWQGAGHTPFVINPPAEAELYMDTTIWFVRDFLYDLVCDGVTTSVNENIDNENLSFSIFPNPNSGNFFIRQDSNDDMSISVFDNVGRVVFSQSQLQKGVNHFDLELPQGMYTVHLYSDGGDRFQAQKIIVQE